MTPEALCAEIRKELAQLSSDGAWARGARGLCEMYAGTEALRFELILSRMARGSAGSALVEVAKWLLPRRARQPLSHRPGLKTGEAAGRRTELGMSAEAGAR
jgi:hypothetical protein